MDDFLIVLSFAGMAMGPFWALWWDRAFRNTGISRAWRVAAVLVLSLATMLVVFAGPWVLMMFLHGTVEANLAEPKFLPAMALFVGLPLALQTFCALNTSLRA
jgi:hypothetical protein